MKLIVYMECDIKGWTLGIAKAQEIIKSFNADVILDIGTREVENVLEDLRNKTNTPVIKIHSPVKMVERNRRQFHVDILNKISPDIYLGLHEDITKSRLIIRSLKRAFKAGKTVYIHNGKELKTFSDYFPDEVVG